LNDPDSTPSVFSNIHSTAMATEFSIGNKSSLNTMCARYLQPTTPSPSSTTSMLHRDIFDTAQEIDSQLTPRITEFSARVSLQNLIQAMRKFAVQKNGLSAPVLTMHYAPACQ
jgi:hypothetical protein